MMVISPDEGGTNRAIYLANVLGLDMGMFYKRRDYSKVIDGRNPIVAHEFLGASVEGKDVLIIDDMISSGDSMIEGRTDKKMSGFHLTQTPFLPFPLPRFATYPPRVHIRRRSKYILPQYHPLC